MEKYIFIIQKQNNNKNTTGISVSETLEGMNNHFVMLDPSFH